MAAGRIADPRPGHDDQRRNVRQQDRPDRGRPRNRDGVRGVRRRRAADQGQERQLQQDLRVAVNRRRRALDVAPGVPGACGHGAEQHLPGARGRPGHARALRRLDRSARRRGGAVGRWRHHLVSAVTVSTIQTTVMPWVAARNGKVDVVYYGSTATSPDDASAVWNVYDSQFSGGAWTVKQVSNTPNRVGAICLNGSACPNNLNRELLDLFQVAEDPLWQSSDHLHRLDDRHLDGEQRHERTAGDRSGVRAVAGPDHAPPARAAALGP